MRVSLICLDSRQCMYLQRNDSNHNWFLTLWSFSTKILYIAIFRKHSPIMRIKRRGFIENDVALAMLVFQSCTEQENKQTSKQTSCWRKTNCHKSILIVIEKEQMSSNLEINELSQNLQTRMMIINNYDPYANRFNFF